MTLPVSGRFSAALVNRGMHVRIGRGRTALAATLGLYLLGVVLVSIATYREKDNASSAISGMGLGASMARAGGLLRRPRLRWCSRLRYKEPLPAPSSRSAEGGAGVTEKPVALVSFPGSGNTWMRYLLQQATGILTGSVYKDHGLMKSGFPAEQVRNSSVLVVKTHEWGTEARSQFSKAILLIRSPADAILAEFNRQSGGHIGFASIGRYKRAKGKYWQQFVSDKLWAWEQTNMDWGRNFTGALEIVYFDKLVENVEGTLRRVLQFLDFPIDETLLSCAIARKEGIYRRNKKLSNYDPYSPEMKNSLSTKRELVFRQLGVEINNTTNNVP